MFTRKELSKIGSKAILLADVKGTNPQWVRAYVQLADAVDRLDAMIARTEDVKISTKKEIDD